MNNSDLNNLKSFIEGYSKLEPPSTVEDKNFFTIILNFWYIFPVVGIIIYFLI